MYAFILVIWTAATGGTAYVINENGWLKSGEFTSERACIEAADRQNVSKFKCLKSVKSVDNLKK